MCRSHIRPWGAPARRSAEPFRRRERRHDLLLVRATVRGPLHAEHQLRRRASSGSRPITAPERNDLAESFAAAAQLLLAGGSDHDPFASNDHGAIEPSAAAGLVVPSAGNVPVNEDSWGTYSGIRGQPCVWLTPTSCKATAQLSRSATSILTRFGPGRVASRAIAEMAEVGVAIPAGTFG